MRELTANRTLEKNMGIQNSLPTLRYLMAFKVFQPSTHKDTEITQKTMFDITINQFIFIPKVFSTKTYDKYFGI